MKQRVRELVPRDEPVQGEEERVLVLGQLRDRVEEEDDADEPGVEDGHVVRVGAGGAQAVGAVLGAGLAGNGER